MAGGWTTRPLGDCAVWYSGGTPNKSTPEYWGGAIPWISAKSLEGFFIADSEVRDLPHKNLAVDLLRKLLNDELKTRSRKNVVQSRSFSEMLEQSIRRYQIRAWLVDDETERRRFIARRIIHLLLRRLQRLPSADSEDAPPLTIFSSHAKRDVETEPRVVKALLAHLTANQPQKTWFDSGEIEVGSRFAKEIEGGVGDAALLAVLTDSYSSSSWCRREVLLAKHFQRPVIVVDAIQKREVRSFPYVGNVPVVRWKNDAQEVIDLLLREALRQAYAAESLDKRKHAGDVVLPAGPELLSLVSRKTNEVVLYPDPPIP